MAAFPYTGAEEAGGCNEEFIDEEDEQLFAIWLSMNKVVKRTDGVGDCGIDTLCMMAGVPISVASRTEIRHNLADFVSKHRGNRALIRAL